MEGHGGQYNEVRINLNQSTNPQLKTFVITAPYGNTPQTQQFEEKLGDKNNEATIKSPVQEAKALIEGGNCKRVRNHFMTLMEKSRTTKQAPRENRFLVESAGPKDHVIVHDTSPKTIQVSPGAKQPVNSGAISGPGEGQTNSVFLPINRMSKSSVHSQSVDQSSSVCDPTTQSHSAVSGTPVTNHRTSSSEKAHSNTVTMALGTKSNSINIPISPMSTSVPILHQDQGDEGEFPTILGIRPKIKIDPKNQNDSGKFQGVGSLALPVSGGGNQSNEVQVKLDLTPPTIKTKESPWKPSNKSLSPSPEVISLSSQNGNADIKIHNGHVIDYSVSPNKRDKDTRMISDHSGVSPVLTNMLSPSRLLFSLEEDEKDGEDILEDIPAFKTSSTSIALQGHRGEFKGRFHIFPQTMGFQDDLKTGPQSSHHFRFSPSINRRQPSRLETVPESLIIDLTPNIDDPPADGKERISSLPNMGGKVETAKGPITEEDSTKDNVYTSEVNVLLGPEDDHSGAPHHSSTDQSGQTSSLGLSLIHEELGRENSETEEQGGPCQDFPDEQSLGCSLSEDETREYVNNATGSFSKEDINTEVVSKQWSTREEPSLNGCNEDPGHCASSELKKDSDTDDELVELSAEEQYLRQRRASVRISAISDSGFQAWIQNEQSHKEKLNGNSISGVGESTVPYMDKLKEMTSKLKLSPRRPSVVAWRQQVKDRPHGPWGRGGEDEVDSKPSLHDFGDVQDESDTRQWAEDRKNRVDEALNWLQRELLYMREQDQTLARTLITLRYDIQQVKLARSYAQHQETIDEVADELATERHLAGHSDILPEHFPEHLKQCGVTKMNINSRRFSVF